MYFIFGGLLCALALVPLSSVVTALWTGQLRDHRPWRRKTIIAVRSEKPGVFWGFFSVQVLLTVLYAVAGLILLAKWAKAPVG